MPTLPSPICGACGYDVTGLAPAAACPECGAEAGRRKSNGQLSWAREVVYVGVFFLFIGALLAVAVTATLAIAFVPPRIRSLQFNSTAWIASPETDRRSATRLRMADDLVASHLPEWGTMAEVRAALGPPNAQDDPDEKHTDFFYILGPGDCGLAPCLEYLVITADDTGAVTGVRREVD